MRFQADVATMVSPIHYEETPAMSIVHATRPAGAPAYFLGREAAVWQTALRRSYRFTPPSGRGPTTRPIRDHRGTSGPRPTAEFR
jgi:hypothetical protein